MVIPLQFLSEAFGALTFFIIFGSLIAFVAGAVYLEHRKEMALIEAGAYDDVKESDNWILGAGLVLLAIGLANVVNAALQGSIPGDGLALTLLGVAALVYYYIKHRGATGATTDAENSA